MKQRNSGSLKILIALLVIIEASPCHAFSLEDFLDEGLLFLGRYFGLRSAIRGDSIKVSCPKDNLSEILMRSEG